MSTPLDNIAGKGRGQNTTLWLWVLALSLLVFVGNTGYALVKTARFGGANTAASNLQVNSQKLANLGREAINGDAASFKAFAVTRDQIVADVKLLNDRFGNAPDVSGPISTVTSTWTPMGKPSALGCAGSASAGRPAALTQPVNTACPRGPTACPSMVGGKPCAAGQGRAAALGVTTRS